MHVNETIDEMIEYFSRWYMNAQAGGAMQKQFERFLDALELLREKEDDTDWKAVAMTLAATLSEIRTDVCCDSRCGQGFYCMGHNELGFTPTRCWIEWAKGEKLWGPEVSGDGT